MIFNMSDRFVGQPGDSQADSACTHIRVVSARDLLDWKVQNDLTHTFDPWFWPLAEILQFFLHMTSHLPVG